MKTALLAAALLLSASPAFASEPLVLVRAQVVSATPFANSQGRGTHLRVQLISCGDARCSGKVNIIVPVTDSRVKPNSKIELLLSERALAKLEEFKSGGSMSSLAMMAEGTSMAPIRDGLASR